MNGTLSSRFHRLFSLLAVAALAVPASTAELDREPINYATAPADNAISRLQERLNSGKTKLKFEDDRGYAKSILAELNVPESSQVLVFSKTSMQRERISPKTPRALYFNDDLFVGFCLRGDVMEFSAADPHLGTVFYTLDQEPATPPRFTRQTENCMICHSSSSNRGMPGHLVRSLYVDPQGFPILSEGSFRTDQTSPFRERWGGWYVTGTHGEMKHMGNRIVHKKYQIGDGNAAGQNLVDLKPLFTTSFYLTPHSDIVALMVLEHQTGMHNLIARASLETRMALHSERELNKSLDEPVSNRFDSTKRRIKSAADDLVKHLLFANEFALTDKVAGTTTFARDFAARGPKDKKGRSLRDFDLQTRLFEHPCSYLIYSEAFQKMPADVKDIVLRKLHDVLTGKETGREFAHLSPEDRRAIREILVDTMPNLPGYWR